jgi:type IV secretion system protein VirB1
MAALTLPAALALAAACGGGVDPQMLVGIARVESGLNPAAVHENKKPDGTVISRDYGLMQINDRNFEWLGVTVQTALDPCVSFAAGAKVLTAFSRYNTGSPTRGIGNNYAGSVVQALRATRQGEGAAAASGTPDLAAAAACPDPDPDGWHVIERVTGCEAGDDDGWRVSAAEVVR